MKIKNIAAVLFFGLCAHAASAQTPVTPPPTTPAPSEPPAVPPAPPVPTTPPAAPKTAVVEGTLFKTQRASNERGKFEWICTYNVAGTKRSVQLDESCPSTLPFELKR